MKELDESALKSQRNILKLWHYYMLNKDKSQKIAKNKISLQKLPWTYIFLNNIIQHLNI